MATGQHTASRRRMLGFIAAAPLAALPVAACVGTHPALARALELEAQGRRMNGGGYSEGQWEDWSAELGKAYSEILALPLTAENARINAKTLLALHDGDIGEVSSDDDTTSGKLMRQIVAALASH